MKHILLTSLLLGSLAGLSVSAAADQQNSSEAYASAAAPMTFVKKRYSIKGSWNVINDGGVSKIMFGDDFKTKGGPDLKVFLSKISIDELDSSSAAEQSVSIGVLKSKSGAQIYTLPEDVKLSDYKSVIIHCEAFSVLWGGFDLPTAQTSAP